MRKFSCSELDLQSHATDVATLDKFFGNGDYSASAPKCVCYSHEGLTTTAIERWSPSPFKLRTNPFIDSECFRHHFAFMGIPTNSRDSNVGKPNDSGLQSDTIYNSPNIHSQTLPLAYTSALILFIPLLRRMSFTVDHSFLSGDAPNTQRNPARN